jgi:pimeloyl-ACP methyl ester carboxylesterase
MQIVSTALLDVAFLDCGPKAGSVALLLHRWPDDPYGVTPFADRLRAHGYRTIVPWLRGFGQTGFRSQETFHD